MCQRSRTCKKKKLVDADDLGDGEGEDDKDGYEIRMQELDGKNGTGDGEKELQDVPKKTTFLKFQDRKSI